MTEYEEKQIKQNIQAYQNIIRYMEEQVQILERELNKNKNFEYKFKITKK